MKAQSVVEIIGPWLPNKGDLLMLWAVADRLGSAFTLAVSSDLGLNELPPEPVLRRVKWPPERSAFASAVRSRSAVTLGRLLRNTLALSYAPRRILESLGVVAGRNISTLLDCSGFAYGDVWPTPRMERREPYYAKLKRQGTTIVLLPQALGPFNDPSMRACAISLFQHFDLMFARDSQSLEHLRDLGVGKVEMAPDITHLVDGILPENREIWSSRVCIVPNARMIDKTDRETSGRYVDFLQLSIRQVRAAGLEPFLLLHETNDMPLASQIRNGYGAPLPIIDEDARVSKGILGSCYAVIGSRFHSLVSALSQGTPAIGTSWSHKYDELFRAYGTPEWLLSPADAANSLESRLGDFLQPSLRRSLSLQLSGRAAIEKAKVEKMWRKIEGHQGLLRPGGFNRSA